jgi:hypothetical protein
MQLIQEVHSDHSLDCPPERSGEHEISTVLLTTYRTDVGSLWVTIGRSSPLWRHPERTIVLARHDGRIHQNRWGAAGVNGKLDIIHQRSPLVDGYFGGEREMREEGVAAPPPR